MGFTKERDNLSRSFVVLKLCVLFVYRSGL